MGVFRQFLCLLLVMMSMYSSATFSPSNVTFDFVEPLLRLRSQFHCCVHHMDLDLFLPGNILYIENNILKTLNLTSRVTSAITRQGDFLSPHSFFQKNITTVVMIDTRNFCIKTVNRKTNQTSILAGQCNYHGYIDGPFSRARFGDIFGSVSLPGEKAYVMDQSGSSVRLLDFVSQRVSTHLRLLYRLIGVAVRWSTRDLYFSYQGGIGKASLITRDIQYFTVDTYQRLNPYGHYFENWVISMRFVTDNLLLIADQGKAIRVLDINNRSTSEICSRPFSKFQVQAGNISQCKVFEPQSFLVMPEENKIVVGFVSSIGYIDISGECAGYMCGSNTTDDQLQCIPYIQVCDGVQNCPQGEDEADCFIPSLIREDEEIALPSDAVSPITTLNPILLPGPSSTKPPKPLPSTPQTGIIAVSPQDENITTISASITPDPYKGTISGIYFASAMVALALIACFTAVILRFTKRKAAIITTQHRKNSHTVSETVIGDNNINTQPSYHAS